jgi:hypothetical protein
MKDWLKLTTKGRETTKKFRCHHPLLDCYNANALAHGVAGVGKL